MATHRIPILGAFTSPDSGGSAYFEHHSVKATSDLFNHSIINFNDTSTRDGVGGSFIVPKDYNTTPEIVVYWTTDMGTPANEVFWEFDYRAIASDEDTDPSTVQQSVNNTATVIATQFDLNITTITGMTAGNLAVDDLVQFEFFRGGDDSADDMAGDAQVFALMFQYADA